MTTKYAVAYVATAIPFLVLDYVWLSKVAGGFYRQRLADLLLDKPNIGVAALFYCLYVVGIIIFAVAPAFRSGSSLTALQYGALFGLFAYATYDLTNYATLHGWSFTVSVVDTIWGAILTGISALLGYLITRYLLA